MNVVEKIISFVSPEKALKRAKAKKKLEILNTGYSYHGASTQKSSMSGWISRGGGVNEDIYKNRKKLVERSRDLFMGAPIATGVLKTIATNALGSGLKLKSALNYQILNISEEEADALEDKIENEFELWADNKIDQLQLLDFYQVQELVFLTVLLNGECFIKLNYTESLRNPYRLKLQIIEPDRVATPREKERDKSVVEGVQLSPEGAVKGYYILKEHPLDSFGNIPCEYVPIGDENGRNIVHVIMVERPEQLRGIPILSPVIESLKQLDRYTEAELAAAVISGMYAIFIESDKANMQGADIGQHDLEDEEDEEDDMNIELKPGIVVGLKPGERANTANPGRPNSQFDPFVTAILRQIGTALEVPYELLIKQFSSNYSASRAALLEAWKMFRKRKEWFSKNFTQIIYEEWIREAYLLGRIPLKRFGEDPLIDKAWCQAQWNGPSQGQIDPLKEAKASIIKIQEGLSTRTRETVELNGGDFEQNIRILSKEQKTMEEKGVGIKNAEIENNEHSEEREKE